jgi:hypothetical protein
VASPVDASRTTTGETASVTTHPINVGSPAAGRLLIVALRHMAAPGTITFTGYTNFASDNSDASDDVTELYWRLADGTEGASDNLTTTGGMRIAGICWQITGAEDPTIQPPECSTVAVGTTAANTANPATLSPTGGSKDYLFLAFMGKDGETGVPTASPTNYSAITTANTGTAGSVGTNGAVGGGSRQLTASSDDPGVFTHPAANAAWAAYTIAIHPPAPVTSTKAGFGIVGADGYGVSEKIAGAIPAPSPRRQRRADRFLTFR